MAKALFVTDIRFEHHPTGLGLYEPSPRISWRYDSSPGASPRDWIQTSYEIEIRRQGSSKSKLFKVDDDNNVLVAWPDSPLSSRERASLRIKAYGISSSTPREVVNTEWSEWISAEAALFERKDWSGSFITSSKRTALPEDGKRTEYFRPIRLRKSFELKSRTSQARLYVTALGVYVAYLNGERIGEEHLAPGWTSYQHRLQYQTFDVSDLLHAEGENMLAIEVAEGWYAGRVVWGEGFTCFYGEEIGALAQLEIDSGESSGSQVAIQTDDTWEWRESPILSSGIYDGEVYDLREEEEGWNVASSQSTEAQVWQSVKQLPFPDTTLLASPCPPVRVNELVKPVKILKSPSGKVLVDFGQNLVGKITIHSLTRPSGHVLTIKHAEVLENGELGTGPLRCAKATDTVTFSDKPLVSYSPHFTFHGFRYIELTGWSPSDTSEPLTLDSISAAVMYNSMLRTGHFSSSSPSLNQLHSNVTWSLRSNFLSIPSDCPQRDERLGWTGDIQVFGPTASFLYDSAGFLSNWLRDLIADQKQAGGVVPFVIPDVMPNGPWPHQSQAIWDDVVILLPWTLYQWTGDVLPLKECYGGMMDHLKVLPRADDGLWDTEMWKLGDWLDPSAPPDNAALARTDGTLVADAYLVHVTRVLAQVAEVLGKTDDKILREKEADDLVKAFRHKYIAGSGLVVGDTQTALALALVFNLHEESDRAGRALAAARLGKWVKAAKFKVSTGFAGTNVILPALSLDLPESNSNLQLAYKMILSDECPSWLYPIKMGATTIWERWDSILPSGEINPGEMTSFNHYALGSVAAWMHETIGGLAYDEDVKGRIGWRKFRVQPQPGGDVTSAKTEYLSGYGWIRCSWAVITKEDGKKRFELDLSVPANSTAVVVLPTTEKKGGIEGMPVGSGEHHFECAFEDPGEWPPTSNLPF
ncbi:putative alpha-L-rhamnosidase [Seiridium unicorne]|uniref:alpha-L-rhamnosidase n=1 Tax=Seiridium unicorne TaxID=138068 RepID=A0ABR2VCG5_9PEZI